MGFSVDSTNRSLSCFRILVIGWNQDIDSCFAEINFQELEFEDASARADEKFVGRVVYIYLLLNLFLITWLYFAAVFEGFEHPTQNLWRK